MFDREFEIVCTGKDTLVFVDTLVIEFNPGKPEFLQLFSLRLIPHEMLYGLFPTKKFSLSRIEEIPFPGLNDRTKRFRIFRHDTFVNPTVFYFELRNPNYRKGDSLADFLKGAELTHLSLPIGWI